MTAIDTVAELMEIAAVTAPKTRGQDFVVVKTITGPELQQLGKGMKDYADRKAIPGFARESSKARSVRCGCWTWVSLWARLPRPPG
jgi:uncharacterized ferredoxin-like protein